MDNVISFLIAFAFVLLFVLPGNIYWLLKKRDFIPACEADAKEHRDDRRSLIVVNVIAIIVTFIIACIIW